MSQLNTWAHIKSPQFDALSACGATVIVPIGSIEQHGPHLPVGVDAMLVTAVAERVSALAEDHRPTLVLPTVSVSLAEHHMAFGGSLTLDHTTFVGVLRCLTASLGRQGFRRILLLNGHGGNMAALFGVVDQLTRELDLPVASASYWNVAAAEFRAILEGQTQLLHACEAETSMMLALAPDLVDMTAVACADCAPIAFPDGAGVHRYRPVSAWTRSGIVGTPSLATADKGHRLLDAAARAIARRLADHSIWPEAAPAILQSL